MLYYAYEFQRQLAKPVRLWANALEQVYSSPYNPLAEHLVRQVGRGERRDRGAARPRTTASPSSGSLTTQVGNETVAVNEEILLRKPFCQLLRFHRDTARRDPKVLVVAPMSGHFATLLRGTVEALLPEHDVHITDWTDAREVPIDKGNFDLDDYVDYIIEFCRYLGPDVHVIAVCQPSVPVMGAAALMAEAKDPRQPKSVTLMGGPIDTRLSPTDAERPGDAQLDDVVPPERDLDGAVQLSGRDAPRLSGLPAAHLLHQHESRPAHQRPHAPVRASGERRRRFGRQPPHLLRRISRRHGPHRRVLPADHRGRVQGAPAATRRLGEPRPQDRSVASSRPP